MKTIKNILKSKITYAVLACLLLVGIFAGISTLAEDVQPTLTITGKNINHAENASIVYQVKVDNLSTEVQAQDRFTMKFWAEAPKSAAEPAGAVVKPYLYTDNADGSFNVHFESIGFAPKDMTTAVYAAACYTDATGKETYSNITRYSVYEYLCEANRNVDKTNEQANLYSAMKDYITYAQKYLGYTEATTPDCIGYVTVHYGYITIDLGRDTRVIQKVGNKDVAINPQIVKGLDLVVVDGELSDSAKFISRVKVDEVGGKCATANIPAGSKDIKPGFNVYWIPAN